MSTTTYTPKEVVAYGCEPKAVPVTIVADVSLAAGTALGKITASGLFDAYDNTASDGTEKCLGILAEKVDTTSAGSGQAAEASMYVPGYGLLKTDQLTGVDACALNDLGAHEMSEYNLTILGGGPQNYGDLQVKRTTVNDAAYTILSTDRLVAVTALSADLTLTLPSASSMRNRMLLVKDESGAANTYNITIEVEAGSDTIDGATSKVISANYGTARLYSNGSAWFTLP